jgi:acetyltransferase
VGGVRVDLTTREEVAAAAGELLSLAEGARLVVQPMRSGLELLVGGVQDAALGPVVAFGLGGVLVEVLDDVAFAAAPLGRDAAARLLDRPRAARLLDGLRGSPAVDRAAIADVVRAVGDLMATFPQIRELDVNPLLAGPDGCTAVDVRLARDE